MRSVFDVAVFQLSFYPDCPVGAYLTYSKFLNLGQTFPEVIRQKQNSVFCVLGLKYYNKDVKSIPFKYALKVKQIMYSKNVINEDTGW